MDIELTSSVDIGGVRGFTCMCRVRIDLSESSSPLEIKDWKTTLTAWPSDNKNNSIVAAKTEEEGGSLILQAGSSYLFSVGVGLPTALQGQKAKFSLEASGVANKSIEFELTEDHPFNVFEKEEEARPASETKGEKAIALNPSFGLYRIDYGSTEIHRNFLNSDLVIEGEFKNISYSLSENVDGQPRRTRAVWDWEVPYQSRETGRYTLEGFRNFRSALLGETGSQESFLVFGYSRKWASPPVYLAKKSIRQGQP